MMKKIIISIGVVIVFAAYVFVQRHHSTEGVVAPPTTASSGSRSQATMPYQNSTTPIATMYKDGQYTGSVADAFYGNIQVAVTVQGGKITDVHFLQYPNDSPTSSSINQQAMPILKQEVLQTQTAKVDTVSGATYTSSAFVQSLTAALTHAS